MPDSLAGLVLRLMRYNVAQLLKEQIGSTRNYLIDDDSIPKQGENRLQLMRTDKGIWASARLNTQASSVCSRCLSTFTQSLALAIEEEFYPVAEINAATSMFLSEEEGAFTIDYSNILDLSEAVRQYRIALGPMKPLCQADCQGLCPTCGTNLNPGPCSCLVSWIDPRLAPLKQLLDRAD